MAASRGRLDTLRDGGKTEPVGETHEVAQEHLVVVVLAEIADEGAVDLDGVDGERLKVAQRGEAGAEIVERDAAAEIAQRADETRRFLDVVQRRRLGDLDHEPAGDIGLAAQQRGRRRAARRGRSR